MNEKNLSYLKDQIKYLGFGEGLYDALQKNIAEGKENFTLTLDTQINRNPFSAMLHFRRPENSDVYYLNKWDATLKNDVGTWEQTFYLNKGHGITLKEGYNLLEGRAVHKELTNSEGEKYKAWLQLDRSVDTSGNYKLHQFHPNYGFDLEKVLSALPIKELKDAGQKEALLKSLGKGNLQAVSFEKNGFIEKLFIAAAPQYKSINTYDHSGAYISLKDL